RSKSKRSRKTKCRRKSLCGKGWRCDAFPVQCLKPMGKQYNFLLAGSIAFLILLFVLTLHVPFFWDAVSKSVRATWLYNHDFNSLVVPTQLNSGHPPLWETLFALSWKIGGRTI